VSADAKSTGACRPATGVCDAAELCDSMHDACPADALSRGHRLPPSAGACDVAETCNGSTANCPTDVFLPSGSVCRAAVGTCDVAETCSGSGAACPPTRSCRPAPCASAGACDLAESCSGSSGLCPADAKSSAVCRAATDVCDAAESCDGGTTPPLTPSRLQRCAPGTGLRRRRDLHRQQRELPAEPAQHRQRRRRHPRQLRPSTNLQHIEAGPKLLMSRLRTRQR
jgi:hypothetical protein